MSFLNLYWAAALAAVVVPLLVLLYFLKLRRRQETVPSTLLWKRAVQDLQVNAPFQKLRKNLLLLLQLLVLGFALTALARPIIETEAQSQKSIILLIDRSASMNTVEPDGRTRLEHAKEQAIGLVRSLNRTGSRWLSFIGAAQETRVMVIAFADRATVTAPFTRNTSDVAARIEAIEPTDERSKLTEALTLAQAYLAQTTIEATPDATKIGSKLVLLSDGCIRGLDEASLRYGEMEHILIGDRSDNVGITTLSVRRNFERPEQVNVFLEACNFGTEPAHVTIDFFIDDQQIAEFWEGTLAPVGPIDANGGEAEGAPGASDDSGSKAAFSFARAMTTGGVLHARLSRSDALTSDDEAYAVIPAPRRLRVLLVGEESFFLESALGGMALDRLDRMTSAEYEAAPLDAVEKDGQSVYDVVVFDKHQPRRFPAGNYVFFGCLPPLEGVELLGEEEASRPVYWDETHALLRHVALEYVTIGKGGLRVKLPQEGEILAEGTGGPLIARYSNNGRHCVIVSFAPEKSSWVLKPSFSVFVYNAVSYLGGAAGSLMQRSFTPGDSFPVAVAANATEAIVQLPDGSKAATPAGDDGLAHFGATSRAGLYRVVDGLEGRDIFAVNVCDRMESDIRPRPVTHVGVASVAQGEQIKTATPEVWRWFVGAALIVLMIEWWVYNRRVMI